MQQTSLTKYAMYLKEKAGIDLVEWDHAWASYSISGSICVIENFWVHPDHRRSQVGTNLLKEIINIAKSAGCNELGSTVMTKSNGVEVALVSQINRGFKIVNSCPFKIYLKKEI